LVSLLFDLTGLRALVIGSSQGVGLTLANRTPAGRWGNVEELVGAAVFLSGAASSFVNGLYVDGRITTCL
jgi:NAD(P)-dependent dehydrogenase (short-subunit alcohol dehydrogenase family)